MLKKSVSFLAIVLGILLFQNCGKAVTGGSTTSGGGATESRVIGDASAYNKIVYDTGLEASALRASARLEVNADSGALSIGAKSCSLDSARLASLKNILSGAQVCEPGPLPAGSVSCMAIGLADIELSNASDSVELRPVICNSGVFLCAGRDAQLRSWIADLIANPPASCN